VLTQCRRLREKLYFLDSFLQVHFAAGLLQPEQTPSIISFPHFLHGVHPHSWHIANPLKNPL
jgi:hypothetical protein